MPVFAEVTAIIVDPDRSSPRFSASNTLWRAMRFLMLVRLRRGWAQQRALGAATTAVVADPLHAVKRLSTMTHLPADAGELAPDVVRVEPLLEGSMEGGVALLRRTPERGRMTL